MPTYDLGDGVNLRHRVYDRSGNLANATVALTVTRPDASTISPAVTNVSTGTYQAATFTVSQVGLWTYVWTVSGTVVDVASGAFTVVDETAPAYTDLDTVKSMLGKVTADDRDDLIGLAIKSAARWIDQRCGRYFYTDRDVSPRIFRTQGRLSRDGCEHVLAVDDFATTAGLIVEVGMGIGTAWTTVTAYEVGPDNAAARLRPWNQIRSDPGWVIDKARITARWGVPAVPDQIAQANALLAARLYRRKDSPQGVLGSADWGVIRVSRIDPDVDAMVAPFAIPMIT